MMQIGRKLFTLALVALVLFSALSVYGGTPKRKGTAGAMELLIPVGSRGTALGGNFTAGITGVEAIYWNPGGLAATDQNAQIMGSYMNYIADINISYVAVQGKLGNMGVIGISLKSMDFGEIPVTTEFAPDGSGETFSPGYTTIGFTFSKAMTDRIFFGVTAKLVNESIITTSASGFGFDFGVQYVFREGLRLGVALRNLGTSMKFTGSDVERRVFQSTYVDQPYAENEDMSIITSVFEMPTVMDIGVAYTLKPMEGHAITTMANFKNHHYGLDGYGAGLEYMFSMENLSISLRGAATFAYDTEAGKFIFQDDQNIFGPSFGGGLFYRMGEHLSINIDYAYQMTEYFDDTQWFTVTLAF
jgi:hypothetical protein